MAFQIRSNTCRKAIAALSLGQEKQQERKSHVADVSVEYFPVKQAE